MQVVKAALIREGWTITHDPFKIKIGKRKTYIDLGAERTIGAEKDGERIAVEIKSFLGQSEVDDLENALGQFGMYRVRLKKLEPDRRLYLAVPMRLRELLVEENDFHEILIEMQVRLILYDPDEVEETEWIELPNTVQP